MKYIAKVIFVVCVFCITSFSFGYAQGDLATAIQEKYKNITRLEAQFSQKIIHRESGAQEAREGVLYFSKPFLVRWETKKPSEELLVVNEKIVWNVFPEEEIAYKYPVSIVHETHNILQVITGQSRLDTDFDIEYKGQENATTVLHLFPKEPVQSLVAAIFWVDPQTMLIQRFRLTDFYGNHNDITFTQYTIDQPLQQSLFTYTPPKDFVIEDRSKDPTGMHKNLLQ